MTIFDAAMKYRDAGNTAVHPCRKRVRAPAHRGTAAAKGPFMQGVKAVIAESYERIHRSNLIGMGILPLQFINGESAKTLKLTGTETFNIDISDATVPQQEITVQPVAPDGSITTFKAISRIDTPIEIQYYRMAVFFARF